jgi:hypothetical protein
VFEVYVRNGRQWWKQFERKRCTSRIRLVEEVGFLKLHRIRMAQLRIALEGLPFRSDSAEVRIEVFPTHAREFHAWRRRDGGVCLWWRGFLVRVVDDGGNGCEVVVGI